MTNANCDECKKVCDLCANNIDQSLNEYVAYLASDSKDNEDEDEEENM